MSARYKRFIVLGAKPVYTYTGTVTYTSMRTLGKTNDKFEVKKLVEDNYDDCGGFIHVIDIEHENDPSIPFQG